MWASFGHSNHICPCWSKPSFSIFNTLQKVPIYWMWAQATSLALDKDNIAYSPYTLPGVFALTQPLFFKDFLWILLQIEYLVSWLQIYFPMSLWLTCIHNFRLVSWPSFLCRPLARCAAPPAGARSASSATRPLGSSGENWRRRDTSQLMWVLKLQTIFAWALIFD